MNVHVLRPPPLCPRCQKQLQDCACDEGRAGRYAGVLMSALQRVSGEQELRLRLAIMREERARMDVEIGRVEAIAAELGAMRRALRPGNTARADGGD